MFKRIFFVFVFSFLAFILAFNLIRYGNMSMDFHYGDNGIVGNRDFIGFNEFFNRLSTFNGMTHTIDTFNGFCNDLEDFGARMKEYNTDNVDFGSVIFFLSWFYWCFRFLFSIIGAVLIDVIALFGWFFGIMFGLS